MRALFAIPSVTAVPPIWEPRVPEVTDMPVPTASEEVATEVSAAVPLPYKSWDEVKVVWPVPPEPTRSGVMSVRAPAESKVEVAVPPNHA